MKHTSTPLSRWAWRRLERRALKGHDRELHEHLREVTETHPTVARAEVSWISGVVSLQLSGHRLLLAGVTPTTAWDTLALSMSAAPVVLRRSGRYGSSWWVSLSGDREQVVLARHIQLVHDPGRTRPARMDLPALSGAS